MLLKKYIVKEKRLKKFIVWHKIIICYPSNNSIDRPQSPNTRRLTTFHYIGKEKLTKRKEHNPHIFSSYLFFLLFKSPFSPLFSKPHCTRKFPITKGNFLVLPVSRKGEVCYFQFCTNYLFLSSCIAIYGL